MRSDPSVRASQTDYLLFREPRLSPRFRLRRQNRVLLRLFCVPGSPRGAKPLHVLANCGCLPLISAIARALSSAAKRCRLARAMLSGESSADFLPAIVSNSTTSKARSISRSSGHHRHFSTSVKWHYRFKPATGYPRWIYPASCRP
jgi:hypothetical protein